MNLNSRLKFLRSFPKYIRKALLSQQNFSQTKVSSGTIFRLLLQSFCSVDVIIKEVSGMAVIRTLHKNNKHNYSPRFTASIIEHRGMDQTSKKKRGKLLAWPQLEMLLLTFVEPVTHPSCPLLKTQ